MLLRSFTWNKRLHGKRTLIPAEDCAKSGGSFHFDHGPTVTSYVSLFLKGGKQSGEGISCFGKKAWKTLSWRWRRVTWRWTWSGWEAFVCFSQVEAKFGNGCVLEVECSLCTCCEIGECACRCGWCEWVHAIAVVLESDALCCTILLLTSCIPLSRCTSQVKRCKGWLRWIVCDRTAIPSLEPPSNYTNVMYVGVCFNDFCTLQFWASSGRTRLLCADRRTSDLGPQRTPLIECKSRELRTW